MAKLKSASSGDRGKRLGAMGAFGALAAVFAGKAAAQAVEAPEGFDPLSALGEVKEAKQLADGTLQVVLANGKTLIVEAADYVLVGSEFFIAESAAAALLAVPAGVGAGTIAGGIAGAGAVVAAAGGGGGDSSPPAPPPPPPPPAAPVFTSGATATIAENSTGTVYTATATDADSPNLTYSITGGADANRFTINATTGVVTFVTPPDFEAPTDAGANNVYDLQITASDGTNTAVRSVSVTVTNVNDAAPVFTSGTTATFAENGEGTVYTAAATDADSATVTYAITGGADASRFTINAATGVVTFVTPQNFEAPTDVGENNVYDLQITASDGTNTAVRSVSVTVTNVNDAAPVFTSGTTATFAENGTGTVYTAAATDADSTTVTYAITGGADASRFTINATTGVVTFVTPPDFETPTDAGANNVYDLQITASDGTNTAVRSVAVTVTNINDAAPVFTSGTTATFAENGTGTVYTAAATDADSTTLTYSITGGADASRFTINATTGVVTFVTPPNFEAPTDVGENNVYDLQITASDGTNTAVRSVSVTVTNVNDAAPVFTSGTTATFAENGTGTVYTAAATDADSTTVIYAITGGADASRFTINATTGVVTFVTPPDFEAPTDAGANNVYDLQITASDGTNTTVRSVAVTVTDVAELAQSIDLTTLSAAQGFVIQGDSIGDQAGFFVSSAGDVNGDGFEDLIIGAPFEDGGASDSGDSYVIFGSASGFGIDVSGRRVIDLTTLTPSQGFIIQGATANERSGYSVASGGDVNGDGFDDLIVGAPLSNFGHSGAGAAYVVFGGSGSFGTTIGGRQVVTTSSLNASQGFVIRGDLADDRAGHSVASAGDVNGDGFDDLIIGAPNADSGGYTSGSAFIVFGGPNTFGVTTGGRQIVDLTNLDASQGFIIQGDNPYNAAGIAVSSAGDVNGDGFDDLIVGARNGEDGGSSAGEAYIVFGGAGTFGTAVSGRQVIDLTTLSASEGFVIQGDSAYDRLGSAVSMAGDINGDGFDDLIVGAFAGADGGTTAGEAYVVFGGAGGFGTAVGGRQVIDLTSLSAPQGFIIQGDEPGDALGWSVSSAGDVNGDGFDDLIVGAINGDNGGPSAGEAYVVFGGAGPFGTAVGGRQVIDLTTLSTSQGFIIQGDAVSDGAGRSVSSAGDINGDGFDDLIVGAANGDDGGDNAGEGYVIFGGATGTESTVAVSRTGTASADNFTGNAGNDTFSGIGANDVVRGGAGNDSFSLSATSFADIDGGRGTDTLALSGSGMTLNLTGAGTPRIQSIETIDLTGTGNNTVILDQQAVFDLTEARSGGDATITIRGNAGDTADLGGTPGGFAPGGTVTDGGITYNVFLNGNATVRVQTGVTVISAPPPAAEQVNLTTLSAARGFITTTNAADNHVGFSVAAAGDFNGDGFDDIIIGAYGADIAGTNAGESYIVFGSGTGFGTLVSGRMLLNLSTLSGSAGLVIAGDSANDLSGVSVASAGDVNGDGYDDVIVGAWQGDDGGGDAGEAYVVFGGSGTLGFLDGNGRMVIDLSTFNASSGFIIQGDEDGDFLGFSVSSAGDVNGDGYDDLIVGARRGDDGGSNSGEAYVVFGGAGGFGTTDGNGRQVIDLTALSAAEGFIIQGDSPVDYAGFAVSSAGDINGDGFDDLIVGAPLGANNGLYSGEAYVIFGGTGTFGTNSAGRQVIDLSTLSPSQGFIIEGFDGNDLLGGFVAAAGDVNGDGFDDMIIGAYRADEGGPQSGAAYVVFGSAGGFGTTDGYGRQVIEVSTLSPSEGFVIQPETFSNLLGLSVSSAGDVNGDGYADVIVGAKFAEGGAAGSGEAYVIYGGANGFGTNVSGRQVLDLATLNVTQGFKIGGEANGDNAGRSVSSAGDINGDGYDDIVVGADLGDIGVTDAGQAYVIFCGATGTESTVAVSRTGTGAADNFTGNAGDDTFTNIGAGDVVRGGAGNDTISLNTGGFANIDGGTGVDTVVLSGAGQILDLRGAGHSGLSAIEIIDLTATGAQTVILDRAAVLELAETNGSNGLPTITIRGDASDSVDLRGGFSFSGVVNEGGIDYVTYNNGNATVRVQSGVFVDDTGAAEDIGASSKGVEVSEPAGLAGDWDSGPASGIATLEVLDDPVFDLNTGAGGAAAFLDAGIDWSAAGLASQSLEIIDGGSADLAIQREAQLAADLLLIDTALAAQGN